MERKTINGTAAYNFEYLPAVLSVSAKKLFYGKLNRIVKYCHFISYNGISVGKQQTISSVSTPGQKVYFRTFC